MLVPSFDVRLLRDTSHNRPSILIRVERADRKYRSTAGRGQLLRRLILLLLLLLTLLLIRVGCRLLLLLLLLGRSTILSGNSCLRINTNLKR
jgi:hypothetical protein